MHRLIRTKRHVAGLLITIEVRAAKGDTSDGIAPVVGLVRFAARGVQFGASARRCDGSFFFVRNS